MLTPFALWAIVRNPLISTGYGNEGTFEEVAVIATIQWGFPFFLIENAEV